MKTYALRLSMPLALLCPACLSSDTSSDDTGDPTEATNASGGSTSTTSTPGTDTTSEASNTTPTEGSTSPTAPTGPGDEESDTTSGSGVTIYDIQQGQIPEGTVVDITGAVVTGVSFSGFFAQEPEGGEWSGIWIYVGNDGPDIGGLAPGDVVSVSGTVGEFYDLTQLDIRSGTLTETGTADVPAPAVIEIAEAEEPWESVFVRVEGDFTVTEINPTNNVNEFTLESDDGTIVIDDHIYDVIDDEDALEGFGVGATFTAVQGPLNFSFEEFKIAPREAADLEGYSAP